MARTSSDTMLAKVAGAAQRAYPGVADLYRLTSGNEAIPTEIRRDVVSVIEAMDLLRFHIREATLGAIITPREVVTSEPPKPTKGTKNARRSK